MSEHENHQHSEECMITKDEAAGLAGRTVRTIELWTEAGLIEKFTVGPSGYWVRFCREEVREAMQPRPAGGR